MQNPREDTNEGKDVPKYAIKVCSGEEMLGEGGDGAEAWVPWCQSRKFVIRKDRAANSSRSSHLSKPGADFCVYFLLQLRSLISSQSTVVRALPSKCPSYSRTNLCLDILPESLQRAIDSASSLEFLHAALYRLSLASALTEFA